MVAYRQRMMFPGELEDGIEASARLELEIPVCSLLRGKIQIEVAPILTVVITLKSKNRYELSGKVPSGCRSLQFFPIVSIQLTCVIRHSTEIVSDHLTRVPIAKIWTLGQVGNPALPQNTMDVQISPEQAVGESRPQPDRMALAGRERALRRNHLKPVNPFF